MKIQAATRLKAFQAEVALGVKYLESLGLDVLDKDPNRTMFQKGQLTYRINVEDEDKTIKTLTHHLKISPTFKETKGVLGRRLWVWKLDASRWVSLSNFEELGTQEPIWQVKIVDLEAGNFMPRGLGMTHSNGLGGRSPGAKPFRR